MILRFFIATLLIFLVGLSVDAKSKPYVYQSATYLGLEHESYISGAKINIGEKYINVGRNGANYDQFNWNVFPKYGVDVNRVTNYYLIFSSNGVKYTCVHAPVLFVGRFPREFVVGNSYKVRFNDSQSKMYILKPDGREVRTRIVHAKR